MKTPESALNCLLTSSGLDRLAQETEDGRWFARYRSGTFSFKADELHNQPAIAANLHIKLVSPASKAPAADADNAARLHEALASLSEVQASDIRLWAYLAHGPLFQYMKARWPVSGDKDEMRSSIESRWLFLNESRPRALMRQGVSRLWWAAHLTRSPWQTDPFLKPLQKKDPYAYTRLLFSRQDIFKNLLERSFGRERRILIPSLAVLADRGVLTTDRDLTRGFMRKINQACFHTVMAALDLKSLMKMLNDFLN